MTPRKQAFLTLEIVCVGAYVWYCYSISRMVSPGGNTEAAIYDSVSRVCYRIARLFGTVGIECETRRNELLEQDRM